MEPGLALAQVAHVATLAANKWNITHETYIIVLEWIDEYCPDDGVLPVLDLITGWCSPQNAWAYLEEDEYVYFCEPDLDNKHTALAVLNPPKDTFSKLNLWTVKEGGE